VDEKKTVVDSLMQDREALRYRIKKNKTKRRGRETVERGRTKEKGLINQDFNLTKSLLLKGCTVLKKKEKVKGGIKHKEGNQTKQSSLQGL